MIRHRADLRAPTAPVSDADATGSDPLTSEIPHGRLTDRIRERHTAVQELLTRGLSISGISRELGLDRRTMRRFARAIDIDELLATTRMAGPNLLRGHKPYLRERFIAGCTDAARLTREITERGYRGSAQTVRRYLQLLRAARHTRTAPPRAPSVRQLTCWLTCRPDRLTDADNRRLTEILERSPALAVLREHVRDFAELMVERRGHELTDWMNSVDVTGSPALRSFTAGLRRDLDAVTAGLTLEHSSGPAEGHVTRIKMLKRQMYGRANLDLLRKRVVHLEQLIVATPSRKVRQSQDQERHQRHAHSALAVNLVPARAPQSSALRRGSYGSGPAGSCSTTGPRRRDSGCGRA